MVEIKPYHVRVEVKLKPGYMDSEGITTEKALEDMGYNVKSVSTAKVYNIEIKAETKDEAEEKVKEFSRKLLANPVKDDYKFEVKETE